MFPSATGRRVLILALVVRALVASVALVRGTAVAVDTRSYLVPAQSLISSGHFDGDSAPELIRTPGYPLLLAVGERFGQVALITLVIQVLLSTMAVWLVIRLAQAVGAPPRVSVLAGGLYAVEPLSVMYSTKLLSESLFLTLFTGMLLYLARWATGSRSRDLVWAGALLAIACYVRPVVYYLPPALAVVIVGMACPLRWPAGRVFLHATLFFVVATAPLSLWRWRNVSVAGYDSFSAITDKNLAFYRAAGVIAFRSGRPLEKVQEQLSERWLTPLVATTRSTRGREFAGRFRGMRTEARAILISDPLAAMRITLAGAARTIVGPGTAEWATLTDAHARGSLRFISVLLSTLLVVVYAFAMVGLWRGGWNARALMLPLCTCAYLLAVSSGPESFSRFRAPLMPLLVILAAGGMVRLRQDGRVPSPPA